MVGGITLAILIGTIITLAVLYAKEKNKDDDKSIPTPTSTQPDITQTQTQTPTPTPTSTNTPTGTSPTESTPETLPPTDPPTLPPTLPPVNLPTIDAFNFQGCSNPVLCPSSVGGLTWGTACGTPWDATYRFRCVNAIGNTSAWTDGFGPVTHYGFHGPKVSVRSSGRPCPIGQTLEIQRKRGSGSYSTINPLHWNGTEPYSSGSSFFDKTTCS